MSGGKPPWDHQNVETAFGTRHNEVSTGCRVEGSAGGNSFKRYAQILEISK